LNALLEGSTDGLELDPLLADFVANAVLLLIERALFDGGNVAMVLRRHESFLSAHETVLPVQAMSLRAGNFSLVEFAVNAVILIRKPVIDFGAARMVVAPGRSGSHITEANQEQD
jgi:hypothetical protein